MNQQGASGTRIRNRYQPAVHQIMINHRIQSHDPGYEVPPNATFEQVVQYTDWHTADRPRRTAGGDGHYRYDRYAVALSAETSPNFSRRIAHVDIGCGAGLFSWVFLDWARERGIEPRRLALYGYDRSNEMIRLAAMLRHGLREFYPGYPDLRYSHIREQFLRKLTATHDVDTDYMLTFGYVLAGNHTDDDINTFTQIVEHIADLNGSASCVLISSDATSGKHSLSSMTGWNTLLQALQARGVECTPAPVATLYTGDRRVLVSRREV